MVPLMSICGARIACPMPQPRPYVSPYGVRGVALALEGGDRVEGGFKELGAPQV